MTRGRCQPRHFSCIAQGVPGSLEAVPRGISGAGTLECCAVTLLTYTSAAPCLAQWNPPPKPVPVRLVSIGAGCSLLCSVRAGNVPSLSRPLTPPEPCWGWRRHRVTPSQAGAAFTMKRTELKIKLETSDVTSLLLDFTVLPKTIFSMVTPNYSDFIGRANLTCLKNIS